MLDKIIGDRLIQELAIKMPSGVPLDPEYWKKYYIKNRNKILAYEKEWRAKNKDKIYARRKNNLKTLANRAAVQKKREAFKIQACPSWANFKAIEMFYIQAKNREADFGIKYHVDHIIPLQGKYVCGLHVENNLQILPAIENLKKSNKEDLLWDLFD